MATLHALTGVVVLAILVVSALQLVALVRLHHAVEHAADLAALASSRAAAGGQDGCDAARVVAERNGVELQDCEMALAVGTVTARSSAPTVWGRPWTARATARAAPTDYVLP